jgi:hypothetical protein
MDTNKENELMQNLEKQTPGGNAGHLADGRPAQVGAQWMAANPPQPGNVKVSPGAASSQATSPAVNGANGGSQTDIESVTPEMVNRIEMYGAEAVYNADGNSDNSANSGIPGNN